MDTPLPGVELAPLPREQVGPFLLLGVAKDADAETIEAHWAQRVLWARQGKTHVPLEDIHWARQVLRDPERRLAADAASLNPDTAGDPPDPTGSALQRLCAEMIALRERSDRQHKLFDQALAQVRDDLGARFGRFAADAQSAYQRLRDELTGEKRVSLALLNALADAAL